MTTLPRAQNNTNPHAGKGWAFLSSARWLQYTALLVIFSVVCVLLGLWQYDRREGVLQENDRIIRNYDAQPVAITDLLESLESFSAELAWHPVVLEGRYLVDEQLLARTRPYQGYPGFEVLSPLLLSDGTVFVVNRGWLPTGFSQDSPDTVPTPPAGSVTVTVRLRPGEPDLPGRTAPEGQVSSIDLPSIMDHIGKEGYQGFYGLLVNESPSAQTGTLPSRPQLTEGPHLSYSLQWFVFSIMGIFGYGWLARKEYRQLNPTSEKTLRWEQREEKKKAQRKKTDAEIEDELLG